MGPRNISPARSGRAADSAHARRARSFANAGAYREFLASRYASDGGMRELTVSVVMPTYNGQHDRLLAAVRSVLASTHAAIELIVVDDGSDEPVADWLPQAEPDPRITVRRQANAGQGPARNAGVAAATGEFVFFIDDDDHIDAGAIALLVAHAESFDADVVVGTRVLVDEQDRVLNLSLEYLPGSTFRVYHGHTDYPFTDQMVHGRIIRRRLLLDSGIRFESGHYEDRLFATRLYLAGPAHFTNIPTYRWTQYTTRSTSSSVMSVGRLHDKMRSLEACWEIMPRHLRPRFMREVLALDLTRFFGAWPAGDEEYRETLLNEVGAFLRERSSYLAALRRGSLHEVAKAIEASDENAMWRLYPGPPVITAEPGVQLGETSSARPEMDDYFCHTHYHVLFALLLSARRQRPAQIFIYTAYQHFSPRFLAALEAWPWVRNVVTYTMGNVVTEIEDRLEADPATVDLWLPHLMRTQFAPLIEAIGEDDQCFAFNDTLPSWYVIEASFPTLTRVEDAYASMSRELDIHHTYGKWDRVLERLGSAFPPTIYASPKITLIIVGAQPEQVPSALAPLITTFDPLAAMDEHRAELREFFARAYEGASIRFTHDTVLLYTQPLAHIGHCSRFEQLEMYRGMIAQYGGSACVIKPHPADTVDYRSLGVPVMDRTMPAEALNLIAENADIDLAVSFSSSAVNTTRFARRRLRLFGDDLTDPAEIRLAILSFIPGHDSPRFQFADAVSTLRYSSQRAARARATRIRAAAADPRALLGWPMWKLRSLLDVGRRRLPL